MNTFLPSPSFKKSVRVLDTQRLNAQRREAWQIYRTLTGVTRGWRNHPAVRMWAGHETALLFYTKYALEEWEDRGYRNDKMADVLKWIRNHLKDKLLIKPPWVGNKELHASHRANLVRKKPEHYRDFHGFTEEPQDGYFWPVKG